MIHALPGMGADERMFPSSWNKLPDFVTHNWKSCFGKKTLPAVAETICTTGAIGDGDSLVGASLGGMVACEITKIRKIKALFLIGSAIHKDEISSILRTLHPLAKVAPFDWLRISAEKIPHQLAQMFADSDPDFIRAMCAAIFDWQGLAETTTKVYRIHGQHDLVIPAPKSADLILKGGHLISISHASNCVQFIQNQLMGK
jgi:pimeloyl-ACP methyl ester carboxylesterase